MTKNVLQEQIAALYLRLNGYFLSGFIVHSPHEGKKTNKAQVDILAVRFPHNSEPERQIKPSRFLQVSNKAIDFLICEVKGGKEKLQFNEALREDQETVSTTLRWMGAFPEAEIKTLAKKVRGILVPTNAPTTQRFPWVESRDKLSRIRAIIFAPDRSAPRPNQIRFVCGEEIVNFIWRCLRPASIRSQCAARYDFKMWGKYEGLVRIFKGTKQKPSMDEIYSNLSKT